MSRTRTQSLDLFTEQELQGIQPSGSAWIVSDDDPATVPVPLQTVIVNVEGPYTERDRKLWVFLLHAVFEELGEKPLHTLPIRDINSIFRELGGEHGTKWLWESAKRLAKTTVEWEYTLGDDRVQGIASLFSAEVHKAARSTGNLRFGFPPLLIPILKEPTRFARLRVHFLLKLSGKYAVTLYEILEGFINRRDGQCRVTIDELRTWLKVPNGTYPTWKNFKLRVLDPAVKQINDDPLGAGFSVEYEPIRKGRFYHEIIFQLTKTDKRALTDKALQKNAKAKKSGANDQIQIPNWAEEKAREIAHKKGWDYQALRQEWLSFAADPDNPGAAFVGFCKKKQNLR